MHNVERGTTVECDGFRVYPVLKNVAVDAKVYDCASGDLKWLHKALSNLKAFLIGTYHGRCEQLQSYLDEYCFRFNADDHPTSSLQGWLVQLLFRLVLSKVDKHVILLNEEIKR